MKLQLLSIPLLVALMLSPLAAAAAGSITFSSPTAGASYTGQGPYTISGTISPAPTGADNVNIQVTEQGASGVLDVQNVVVGTGGTFSYDTLYGGNTAWTTGTYVITATDSGGAAGTTTFKYTATGTTGTPSTSSMIDIFVAANTPVYSGQTVNVEAMLVWSVNGTLVTATNTTITATLQPPTGAATSLGTPSTTSTRGQYYWTTTLPAGSADGAYFIQVVARHGPSGHNSFGWGLGSFTVNSAIAPTSAVTSLAGSITALQTSITGITSSLATITTSLSGITSSLGTISSSITTVANNAQAAATAAQSASTAVTSLQNSVNTLSASISSITGSLTTLQNGVSGLTTTVNSLSGLSNTVGSLQTSVNDMNSTVSNDQTYILVVAALAVITLVLELAILIRKLS